MKRTRASQTERELSDFSSTGSKCILPPREQQTPKLKILSTTVLLSFLIQGSTVLTLSEVVTLNSEAAQQNPEQEQSEANASATFDSAQTMDIDELRNHESFQHLLKKHSEVFGTNDHTADFSHVHVKKTEQRIYFLNKNTNKVVSVPASSYDGTVVLDHEKSSVFSQLRRASARPEGTPTPTPSDLTLLSEGRVSSNTNNKELKNFAEKELLYMREIARKNTEKSVNANTGFEYSVTEPLFVGNSVYIGKTEKNLRKNDAENTIWYRLSANKKTVVRSSDPRTTYLDGLSTSSKDLKILGLKIGAKFKNVKKAYRKMSRESHPDKVDANEKKQATERFTKVNEAYANLKERYESNTKDRPKTTTPNPRSSNKERFTSNTGGQYNPPPSAPNSGTPNSDQKNSSSDTEGQYTPPKSAPDSDTSNSDQKNSSSDTEGQYTPPKSAPDSDTPNSDQKNSSSDTEGQYNPPKPDTPNSGRKKPKSDTRRQYNPPPSTPKPGTSTDKSSSGLVPYQKRPQTWEYSSARAAAVSTWLDSIKSFYKKTVDSIFNSKKTTFNDRGNNG